MNTITTVPFHGQNLVTIQHGGDVVVAMKPIVEGIGLDWHAQRQRIKRHPVLSEGAVIINSPSKSGDQQYTCLPLEMLNGWLFGVDVNRVKPEIRDTLLMYQRECFHVLFSYWRQGEAVNPQFTLTPEHQHGLRKAIARRVQTLPKGIQRLAYARLYSHLHERFSVAKYDQIDDSRYTEALAAVETCEMEGEFIAAQSQGDVLTDHDLSNLYCLLVHVDMICKRWAEYRIEDVLRLLKSPAAGQMCEHIGDARRLKNTLVRTRGDAMASARHRRGMNCNIHKLYG